VAARCCSEGTREMNGLNGMATYIDHDTNYQYTQHVNTDTY